MKLLIRMVVAVCFIAALGLVLLAVVLPRIVQSEMVRARIQSAARSALGRDVQYASLDVGLFPPSLLVEAPRVVQDAREAAPPLAAERVALRIALLPLLARTVVIDSLVIDGAALRLVRTAQGIELPFPAAAAAGEAKQPTRDASAAAEATTGADAVRLAVREVTLRDGSVVVEDRVVRPSITWELRDIDAAARGESLERPVALDASFALASGGTVEARGSATLGGDLDLTIEIAAIPLRPFAPYLNGSDSLDGLLAGSISLEGPAASPSALSAALSVRDARFELGDLGFSGAITARAEIADPVARATGSFALDAGAAELHYGGSFTKPVGTPATVTGKIVTDAAGALGIDDVVLRVGDLEASGSARAGPPLSVELRTQSLELRGIEALLPGLAALHPSGRVRVESLRFSGEPKALVGTIRLEDLVVSPPNLDPITLRGALIAKGATLDSRDLQLVAAEQSLAAALRVRNLFGALRYELDLAMDAADANALTTALARKPDMLYGPLALHGALRGSVESGRSPLETLGGELRTEILNGRLVGASLLQATFGQLGAFGKLAGLALDAGRLFGGRDLQRFYGDAFDAIEARLRIADGVLHAEPLVLRYPQYSADLTGTIQIVDLAIDLRGTITILETVDAAIASEIGIQGYKPARRAIRLASVRGTLDAPVVQIAGNDAVNFVGIYAGALYGGRLQGILDKEIGSGAGKVLEGILGGDRE